MKAVWGEEAKVGSTVVFPGVRAVAQERLRDDGEVVARVVAPGVDERLDPAQIPVANRADLVTVCNFGRISAEEVVKQWTHESLAEIVKHGDIDRLDEVDEGARDMRVQHIQRLLQRSGEIVRFVSSRAHVIVAEVVAADEDRNHFPVFLKVHFRRRLQMRHQRLRLRFQIVRRAARNRVVEPGVFRVVRPFVDGVSDQVWSEISQQIGESDDVILCLPAAAIAVPAHGEGAAAVLDEQAEGGACFGAVGRRQGISDPRHQLDVAREEVVNISAVLLWFWYVRTVFWPISRENSQRRLLQKSGVGYLELGQMVSPCFLNVRIIRHRVDE